MGSTGHRSLILSSPTLTTDDNAPDHLRDYNPYTWASLMEETLDGVVTSCVQQANLHWYVHSGSRTPLGSSTVPDNMLSLLQVTKYIVIKPQCFTYSESNILGGLSFPAFFGFL